MPTWYSDGTVSVTNGNTTVTGSGTAWVASVKLGQAIYLPDGRLYEIAVVVSNTQITLATPYQGSTQTGAVYQILPIDGLLEEASNALFSAIDTMRGHNEGTLAGRFPVGTNAQPSVRGASDGNTGVNLPGGDVLDFVTNAIRRARLSSAGLQLDAPLIGTAVMASLTDTTGGKVVTNGGHGLGTLTPPAVTDLDAFDTPNGWYRTISPSLAGVRPTHSGAALSSVYGFLHVQRYDNGGIKQVYTSVANAGFASMRTWEREGTIGGGWNPWRENYSTRNVLGAVSQSGGSPTGGLFEYGSNANGSYLRLADGTQICWGSQSLSSIAIGVAYAGGFRSGSVASANFPAPFAASPNVNSDTNDIATGDAIPVSAVRTSTTVQFRWWRAEAGTVDVNASYTAIGRWF
ncbi:tail fiber protein [Salipiger pallidus]|uniref:Tail fiber protein n=1 Tax=Salipiger pallidus TaxID=1775170 RepID=A0A8J2ZG12_9RHOB|nr:pyocin knob domain-containing protein [Salipiger pallidus]GGG59702.1 tail fiber protein [Salipiger pallidus]